MNGPTPHFLLFSESGRTSDRGQWRFVLQSLDGAEQLEAADTEPEVQGERLELLAVVRGLEALPQPSRVTLVTPSRYVNRGLNYGLAEWRTNDWQWERFGEMAPIKNRDLWQRIDRALEFHSVDCRPWKFDPASKNEATTERRSDTTSAVPRPHYLKPKQSDSRLTAELARRDGAKNVDATAIPNVSASKRSRKRRSFACTVRRVRFKCLRSIYEARESLGLQIRQLGTRFLPPAWMD